MCWASCGQAWRWVGAAGAKRACRGLLLLQGAEGSSTSAAHLGRVVSQALQQAAPHREQVPAEKKPESEAEISMGRRGSYQHSQGVNLFWKARAHAKMERGLARVKRGPENLAIPGPEHVLARFQALQRNWQMARSDYHVSAELHLLL